MNMTRGCQKTLRYILLALFMSWSCLASAQAIYVERMRLLSETGKEEPDGRFTGILRDLLRQRGFKATTGEEDGNKPPQGSNYYVVYNFVQKTPFLDAPPCQFGGTKGHPVFRAAVRRPDGTEVQLEEVSGEVNFEDGEIRCPSGKIAPKIVAREAEMVLVKLVNQIDDVIFPRKQP